MIESGQTIQQNMDHIKNLEEMVESLRENQKSQSINGYGHPISQRANQAESSKNLEFEEMKQEKAQLNKKLDEFSNILREFQVNQKHFENENKALK